MIEKRINNDCYLVYDDGRVKYVGNARELEYHDGHEFTLTGVHIEGNEDDARFVHGIATAVHCPHCGAKVVDE